MDLSCFFTRTCVVSVVSRLEQGYCDLNQKHEKPLPAALGMAPLGKYIRNAQNLKTWYLAKFPLH